MNFTVTGSKGHHTWTITTTEVSTDNTENTSSMSISLTMAATSYTWAQWGGYLQYRLKVCKDGDTNTVYYDTNWRNAPDHYPNADSNLKWVNGDTFEVAHEADGSQTIRIYFEFLDYAGQSYTPGYASGNDDFELTTIPRYVNATLLLSSKTETTANFIWETDENCDAVKYTLDEGTNWTNLTISSATTSGTFSLSSLTANTNYKISIQCRREDSQQWTWTPVTEFTTYNYPYVKAISQASLSIGSAQTVTIENPLGRSCTVYMKKDSADAASALYSSSATTGTSLTFTPTAATLYNSIPDSTTGNAVYYCLDTNNHRVNVVEGVYTCVTADCIPTLPNNAISYTDTNNATKTVMEDSGVSIVQNQSTLSVTISAATPKHGASISSYVLTLGSLTKTVTSAGTINFGKINFSQNTDLILYVVDSRGFTSAAQTKTVTIVPWERPTIRLDKLQRRNNYETTVYLKVTRTAYSSLNGKNASYLGLTYAYTDGTISGSGSLTSGTEVTLTGLNSDTSFTFTITSIDAFSAYSYTYSLDKGMPIAMIDADLQGVGVNCFPSGNGLYLKDKVVFGTSNAWTEKIDTADNNKLKFQKGNYSVEMPEGKNGTLALISEIALLAHPVGSIYISTVSTSPQTLFGGTWVQITDKFLYATSSTSKQTGGNSSVTLTEANIPQHSHSIPALTGTAASDGAHTHQTGVDFDAARGAFGYSVHSAGTSGAYTTIATSSNGAHTHDVTTEASTTGNYGGNNGSTTAVNILPPYYTVYAWERTA